ncbi:MAG: hypothetical protein ABFD89_26235 [Bryobacteraceae bacterium]
MTASLEAVFDLDAEWQAMAHVDREHLTVADGCHGLQEFNHLSPQ